MRRTFLGSRTKKIFDSRCPYACGVTNWGDTTAESVRIEVVLRRGEEEVERAELDLAFVPSKSEREGWVTFREDPRCCAIVTRAVSYERP